MQKTLVEANATFVNLWLSKARIIAVVGHSGSGKTEFCVNLVQQMAELGYLSAIADIDIVNPYFRSRERSAEMKAKGITVITSSQSCSDADLPSIPAELSMLFDKKDIYGVMDIGGDPVGARVLARSRHRMRDAEIWYVANANRPQTATPEEQFIYLRNIEKSMGLKVTGIVNNTHLCDCTEIQDILHGAETARALSAQTGVPVVCHTVPYHLAELCPDMKESLFYMKIQMRKPWEEIE